MELRSGDTEIERNLVPDVRKIAVLRTNGIGDYVFAIPALEALRNAYPAAEIVLLGSPWHAEFLNDRPGPVDRVVVVPSTHGVRDTSPDDPRSDDPVLEPFFERMRAEHFDLALQLHGGGANSNPFVQRLGARLTAGHRAPGAPPLDRWITYDYWQREVLRYLEAVSLVGARAISLDPRLTLLPGDLAEASQALPTNGRPIVALHPGAGDPRRRWPAERFAVVGDALAAAGLRVVLTGSQDEAGIINDVTRAMRHDALDLAGAVSLGGLAALFARCSLVVSNDSGPLHLARAVDAPTVGLYWCGNVVNAGPMTQARHRVLLSWTLICPQCGRDHGSEPKCDCPVSFVTGIQPGQVIETSLELLQAAGLEVAR